MMGTVEDSFASGSSGSGGKRKLRERTSVAVATASIATNDSVTTIAVAKKKKLVKRSKSPGAALGDDLDRSRSRSPGPARRPVPSEEPEEDEDDVTIETGTIAGIGKEFMRVDQSDRDLTARLKLASSLARQNSLSQEVQRHKRKEKEISMREPPLEETIYEGMSRSCRRGVTTNEIFLHRGTTFEDSPTFASC